MGLGGQRHQRGVLEVRVRRQLLLEQSPSLGAIVGGVKAGTVGVREDRIGQVVVRQLGEAKDVLVAELSREEGYKYILRWYTLCLTYRITVDGHNMPVIGGDHYKGVLLGGQLSCHLHSLGKLGSVLEGSAGIGVVVGHVDAGALHKQEESLVVASQNLDGGLGQLAQRRIGQLAAIPVPVSVVGQVGSGKEAQQVVRAVQIHQAETLAAPHIVGGDIGRLLVGQPVADQVAAIGAIAGITLLVPHGGVDEVLPATAEDHLEALAHRLLHQLAGNVDGLLGITVPVRHLPVVLPVAIRSVGIDASRRGMCHPGGGHQSRILARRLSPLGDAHHLVLLHSVALAVVPRHLRVDANGSVVALDAAQVGGGRAGGVRHLPVDAVRLRQARVGKALEVHLLGTVAEQVSCGGHRVHGHAVAQKEDHVLGLVGVRRLRLGQLGEQLVLGLVHPVLGLLLLDIPDGMGFGIEGASSWVVWKEERRPSCQKYL